MKISRSERPQGLYDVSGEQTLHLGRSAFAGFTLFPRSRSVGELINLLELKSRSDLPMQSLDKGPSFRPK